SSLSSPSAVTGPTILASALSLRPMTPNRSLTVGNQSGDSEENSKVNGHRGSTGSSRVAQWMDWWESPSPPATSPKGEEIDECCHVEIPSGISVGSAHRFARRGLVGWGCYRVVGASLQLGTKF